MRLIVRTFAHPLTLMDGPMPCDPSFKWIEDYEHTKELYFPPPPPNFRS